MAMHSAKTAAERYRLVEEINAGLAANGGAYQAQVGDYRLTCTSEGGAATMLFENELLMVLTIEPEDGNAPTVEITGGE